MTLSAGKERIERKTLDAKRMTSFTGYETINTCLDQSRIALRDLLVRKSNKYYFPNHTFF